MDGDHPETINLGKAGFGTSLATPRRREVGLQEICRICGSGHYSGIVRTESNEQLNHQGNDDAQCGGNFDRNCFCAQLGRISAIGILRRRSGTLIGPKEIGPSAGGGLGPDRSGGALSLNLEAQLFDRRLAGGLQ